MQIPSIRPLAYAVAATLAIGSGALAAQAAPDSDSNIAQSPQIKATLTPSERGELTRQFVRKWGVYVQKVHGADVHAWARNMVSTFARVDAANFQNALRRSTFEGAMATLDGAGHKLSDDAVIDALARDEGIASIGSMAQGEDPGAYGTLALGDVDKDLVFTAVPSCRIVDTRLAGGAITGGSFRIFSGRGLADFSTQGGSATDCGLNGGGVRALSINVTAVAPPATGFATVYPSLIATPVAATMIYQTGITLSNGATVGLASNGNFRIFSERTVHYVVDVVGYYGEPVATALSCTNETSGPFTVTSGNRSFTNVACPAGYTVTGGGAATGTNLNSFINAGHAVGNAWFSSVQNNSGVTRDYTHYATCCRVPGR
jgi:hypothetical protein